MLHSFTTDNLPIQCSETAVASGLALARVYEKFLLAPAGAPVDAERVLQELIATLSDPHHKKPHSTDAAVCHPPLLSLPTQHNTQLTTITTTQ